MSDDALIHLRVPAGLKAGWVRSSRAQGMKLGDWIVGRISVDDDFSGFTLNVPAFVPFERYVLALSTHEVARLLRALKVADAAQPDAVASIKIARSFLEKRSAMDAGIADKDLFHDINVEALGYFAAAPGLSHFDLLSVLIDVWDAPE